jgi:hypothetical protein
MALAAARAASPKWPFSQRWHQVEELEHKADTAPAEECALALRHAGQRLPIDPDLAAAGRINAADQVE